MRPTKKERKENLSGNHDRNSPDESDNESLISAASRSSRRSTRSIGSRRSGTPLSITLRSHCKQHGSTCTEGHGLEFRNRISPSPKRRSPTRHSRGSPDSLPAQIVSKKEQNGRSSSLAKRALDMSLKDSIETSAQRRVLRSRTVDISQASNVTVDESLQQFLKEQRAATKDITIAATGTTTTSQAVTERFIITNSEDTVTKVSEQHFTSSTRTRKTSDYSSDEEVRKIASHATRAAVLPPSAAANSVAGTHGIAQRMFNTISHVGNQFLSTTKTSASQKPTSAYLSAAAIYSSDEDESTVQKTDYTYAHSLSYRPKVTPDRVITPPNMSRRSIKEQTIFEQYTSPVLVRAGMEVDSDSSFGILTRRRGSPLRKVVFDAREGGSNDSISGYVNRNVHLRYGPDKPSDEEESEEEGEEEYSLVPPEQLPQSSRVWWQTRKITRSVVGTMVNSFLWVWNWLYLAICYWMLLDTWVLMKGAHLRQRLAPYKKWALWLLILPILLAAGGLLWGSVSITLAPELEEPSAEKLSFVTLASSSLISWIKSAGVALTHYSWTCIQLLIDLNSQLWSYTWNILSNFWQVPAVLNASVLSSVVPSSTEESFTTKTELKSAPENCAMPETLKTLPLILLQNGNVLNFLTAISQDPQSAHQSTREWHALHETLTQQLAKTREDHEALARKWRDVMEEQEKLKQVQDGQQLKAREYHDALAGKWRDLMEQHEKLKLEQDGQRLQGQADKNGLQGEITALRAQLDVTLAQLEALKSQITPGGLSNSVNSDLMDQKVAALIRAMMGQDATADVDLTKFGAWFRSRLAVRKVHQAELNATLENWRQEAIGLSSKFHAEKQELVDIIRAQVEEKLDAFMALQISQMKTAKLGHPQEPSIASELSRSDVEAIVRAHLRRYDADKTGMADYAMESAGATVVSTRCTEDYRQNKAVVTMFGINLWHKTNSPSIVLEPGIAPGNCWAFKGVQGYLLIRLSAAIRPTAFTIEHISRNLSLTGKIDSAPKKFSVWGFKDEQDRDSVLLGRYEFDEWGDPLQTFFVQHEDPQVFPMVQLNIESNYGNINFTCLYRFRVHGLLPRVH